MKRNLLAALLVFCAFGIRLEAADTTADEQALRKIEQEWTQAHVKRDTSVAQRIESDDFTFVDPDGIISNKAQSLKNVSGDLVFQEFLIDELKIRVYGDAAIASGLGTVKAKFRDSDISGSYRWTDVFVRQNGSWKAVVAQVTKVAVKK